MTRNDLKLLLQEKRLYPTTARLKILSICANRLTPLDVSQVAARAGTSVHIATVYRTLEKFVLVGILEKVDFQEGKFRYEYPQHHHHHAVCSSCGKIEDVVDSGIEAIESRVKKSSGFLVTKHVVELFGTCNNCQQRSHHVQ